MPRPVDVAAVRRFLEVIARSATGPTTVYLVGGATAVVEGWRPGTIDIDLRLEPEDEGVLRALPGVKIALGINVELASPLDFLPELPGWRDRSPFVSTVAPLTVRHLDPYAQSLAKLERGFAQDIADVHAMVDRGLVEPVRLEALFESIVPELFRFPAVDPVSLQAAVRALMDGSG